MIFVYVGDSHLLNIRVGLKVTGSSSPHVVTRKCMSTSPRPNLLS